MGGRGVTGFFFIALLFYWLFRSPFKNSKSHENLFWGKSIKKLPKIVAYLRSSAKPLVARNPLRPKFKDPLTRQANEAIRIRMRKKNKGERLNSKSEFNHPL